MSINTYQMLHNYAAEQGWTEDSELNILCDFMDIYGNIPQLAKFIEQRIADEQSMSSGD